MKVSICLVLSIFSCFKTLHDLFVRSVCLEVAYICTQLLSGVDCPIQRTAVSCVRNIICDFENSKLFRICKDLFNYFSFMFYCLLHINSSIIILISFSS